MMHMWKAIPDMSDEELGEARVVMQDRLAALSGRAPAKMERCEERLARLADEVSRRRQTMDLYNHTFRLDVTLGNAAMSDGVMLARALRDTAAKIDENEWAGTLVDLNGNTVGEYRIWEGSDADDPRRVSGPAPVVLNEQVIELDADVVALIAATFSRDGDTIEAQAETWDRLRAVFLYEYAGDPDDDGMTRIPAVAH